MGSESTRSRREYNPPSRLTLETGALYPQVGAQVEGCHGRVASKTAAAAVAELVDSVGESPLKEAVRRLAATLRKRASR